MQQRRRRLWRRSLILIEKKETFGEWTKGSLSTVPMQHKTHTHFYKNKKEDYVQYRTVPVFVVVPFLLIISPSSFNMSVFFFVVFVL
jgi:hypothetical protein